MAELRTGSLGSYYGSTYSESESLTIDQMKVNAKYIYSYFVRYNWTLNAIAGMLGNMQVESTLNPGRWQSDNVGNTSGGYGLVQWTPATNLFNFCESELGCADPSKMDSNLGRIIYEFYEGLQWISTTDYPISFEEFSTSTESCEYLASAFLKNYERAGVEVEETRRSNARYWYDFLKNEGLSGGTTGGGSGNNGTLLKKKKGFNFVVFRRR